MKPPDAQSLRRILAGRDLAGRTVWGADKSFGLDSVLSTSILAERGARLRGRRVLLATDDQFLAARALIDLDGVAKRIVLCPPDLADEHLPAILARAEIEAVVTDRPDAFAGRGGPEVVDCAWPPLPGTPAAFAGASEWVLLTSGTTGVPKMVSHDLASLTAPIVPKPAPARPLVWATFYDIRRYGGLQMYLRGILGTGSLVLSGRGEATSDFLRRLGGHEVTHLAGTPSHWRRALMSPEIGVVSPLYVRLSGEIADQPILERLKATFPGAGIGHAYASTEAGVAFEVDDGREGFPAAVIGVGASGVEIRIEAGSLRIRSPRAARGYVGSPELSLTDPDGFVDTGDVVERRGDRYVFAGRREGIINVGGAKVHPEEVEAVINGHARVRMCRVAGRRSPITGAIVVAQVMPVHEGDAPRDPAEHGRLRADILSLCRTRLPAHKVPALIEFVDEMGTTGAGKLARHA